VGSPFQAKFVGPYTVAHQISDLNYLINTPDRKKKTRVCHVNLLKPFYGSEDFADTKRSQDNVDIPNSSIKSVLLTGSLSCNGELSTTSILIGGEQDEIDPSILQGRLHNSEALSCLPDRFSHLTEVQRTDLINLIFRIYYTVSQYSRHVQVLLNMTLMWEIRLQFISATIEYLQIKNNN